MRSRIAAALIAILSSLVLPLAAHGATSCPAFERPDGEDGMGGTGLEHRDGMGGTGLEAGGEDGMGGTGIADPGEDGMGGTGLVADRALGVMGTITSFGSICVNGHRIAYDDGTPVEMNGAPATARALAVGQVVAVEAIGGDRGLRATRISVRQALVGPVTRVDASSDRIYVMDRAVALPSDRIVHTESGPGIRVADLGVGTRVAVSGLGRSDGVLAASRLDRVTPGVEASVVGRVRTLSPGFLSVGEVRVAAADVGDPAPELVRVVGRWNAARETLETERVERAAAFEKPVARVSVEGFVRDRSNASFRVSDFDVDGSAVADRLPPSDRESRVVVEGRIDRHGRLHAERILLRPGPSREQGQVDSDELLEGASERGDRGDRGEREDRSGRSDRADRAGRAERAERAERPERPDRGGRR